MPRLKQRLALVALLSLAFLGACGGGSSSTPTPTTATSLAYTDPATGTYLLKKNTALSTTTHLVLDLVGPAATTGSGVSATFNVDTARATWANVAAADAAGTYVQNGTAFNLGTGPQVLRAKVTSGALQVTAAQKGTASPVVLNVPLLRVALDLKGTPTAGPVSLSADGAKCQVLDGTGSLSTITVSTGTLVAQ